MSLVLKFGGTSVGSAAAMRQVADRVEAALPRAPLVVLSAMSGATNALFEAARASQDGDAARSRRLVRELALQHERCARELFDGDVPADLGAAMSGLFEELRVLLRGVYLLRELTPRSSDAIASFGERLSSALFAALCSRRAPTALLDARALLRTDGRFGAARPNAEALRRAVQADLTPRLAPGRVVVTQGYIGSDERGLTTTLGRGGSDYSAALFGAALGAEEVQIWTDVEGILTCDPRIVPEATTLRVIRFDEAAELAAFGAKVLHPATIQPAVEAGIPVTVRHTARPNGGFTTIQAHAPQERAITALATRGPVTVLTVSTARMFGESGFLARLFEVCGRLGVSVDLIATAELAVSLTIEPDAPLEPLVRELTAFAKVEVSPERSIVAVVGSSFRTARGLHARVFGALRALEVEMVSMGANEINLSVVVRSSDAPAALRALHAEFFGLH